MLPKTKTKIKGAVEMGIVLIVVGLFWAIIGFGNIISGFSKGISETMGLFSLIFNFVLFILPGLGVAGIGTLIKKKSTLRGDIGKKCPKCAEEIKIEALVCRFCGYEFQEGDNIPKKPSGLGVFYK